jgi:hypothetical protein
MSKTDLRDLIGRPPKRDSASDCLRSIQRKSIAAALIPGVVLITVIGFVFFYVLGKEVKTRARETGELNSNVIAQSIQFSVATGNKNEIEWILKRIINDNDAISEVVVLDHQNQLLSRVVNTSSPRALESFTAAIERPISEVDLFASNATVATPARYAATPTTFKHETLGIVSVGFNRASGWRTILLPVGLGVITIGFFIACCAFLAHQIAGWLGVCISLKARSLDQSSAG